MKPVERIHNVFTEKDQLYTKYNSEAYGPSSFERESIISQDSVEYRAWNPYRSKLAAALLNGLDQLRIEADTRVLYLGSATGKTVSHIADIVTNGVVYAVEFSSVAMQAFLEKCGSRPNVVPILDNAAHPERYCSLVSSVGLLYQDISQRNQPEIFIKNAARYLQPQGQGLLMVKSRSIDVSRKPAEVYDDVMHHLKENGFSVLSTVDLASFEKDHAAMLVSPES